MSAISKGDRRRTRAALATVFEGEHADAGDVVVQSADFADAKSNRFVVPQCFEKLVAAYAGFDRIEKIAGFGADQVDIAHGRGFDPEFGRDDDRFIARGEKVGLPVEDSMIVERVGEVKLVAGRHVRRLHAFGATEPREEGWPN